MVDAFIENNKVLNDHGALIGVIVSRKPYRNMETVTVEGSDSLWYWGKHSVDCDVVRLKPLKRRPAKKGQIGRPPLFGKPMTTWERKKRSRKLRSERHGHGN